MKAFLANVILSGASTRADNSLSLRFSTGELATLEKAAVMDLQNKNLKMLLTPAEGAVEEMVEVKAPLDFKTPSQRLRGVLFVAFQQEKPEQDFQSYYTTRMEQIIDSIKARLNDI